MFYGCFGWHMALCEIGWWILSNVWVWCFVFFKYLVPSRLGHNLKGQRIELDDIKKDIFSVFMIRIVRRLPCSWLGLSVTLLWEEWGMVGRTISSHCLQCHALRLIVIFSFSVDDHFTILRPQLFAWLSGCWLVDIFIQIRLKLYLAQGVFLHRASPCWLCCWWWWQCVTLYMAGLVGPPGEEKVDWTGCRE